MISTQWQKWIGDAWDSLVDGRKLQVPYALPHPVEAGFVQESIATPAGQCRDWVLSLDDESRIHVHEFKDGRPIAHRDKIDPNRSVLHAVGHFVTETNLGRVLVVVGLCVGAAKLFGSSAATR